MKINPILKKGVLALSLCAGLVLLPKQNAKANSEDTAKLMGYTEATEIEYKKGSKSLTTDEKKELDDLVSKAATKGEIAEVKVLAWSDKEYPAEGQEVSKKDKNLAEDRAKTVKEYLKSKHHLAGSKLESFNMAERPSSLEKIFKTSDYKVKTAATGNGESPTQEQLNFLKTNAKTSTALILVQVK